MHIIKEGNRVLGRVNTRFAAENTKRDAEKINDIFGDGDKVTIEKGFENSTQQ